MFGRRQSVNPSTIQKQEPKSEMSLEKSVDIDKKFKNTVSAQKPNKVGEVVYSGKDIKFHVLVKDQFPEDIYTDPVPEPESVIFRYIVPTMPYRKRVLVLKETTYCVANWIGDGFPNVIYILCDGIDGYLNYTGQASGRVAAMELTEFVATMDDAEQRTYDLKYEIKSPVSWSVAQNDFVFRLEVDGVGSASALPIQNPISINLEIRSEN